MSNSSLFKILVYLFYLLRSLRLDACCNEILGWVQKHTPNLNYQPEISNALHDIPSKKGLDESISELPPVDRGPHAGKYWSRQFKL